MKINLKQIKSTKKRIQTAMSETTLRLPDSCFAASKVLPPQTCKLLPSGWQLYQRRGTLGSKQLCQSFKGEQAGSKQPCQLTRRLCGSPSQNQTVASSDTSANEQSLTSISAVFVTSTISCKVFNRAFHQFYFNPPPDREELGGTWWWAWKIGQLCLRRVLD